ncbi:hypothetical protein CPSG_07588 [Coccidioides posadasii str. Silveira]|uniref:Uncharacterized protein n=1 Tax=Coccidioides posadasii (strain RMSCC 757 / Silveira) TaxID=443226 RepID=E9DCN6_COCPS|nr:hypothetical protein CPSG_07588 [Coccidioides posadasii str. Silveira]
MCCMYEQENHTWHSFLEFIQFSNPSSEIACTFCALALFWSNRYVSHSPANFFANSIPITLCPKQSTCASLLKIALSTLNVSWAVTARIPGTLFAEMATPRPVPQIMSARSTLPSLINWAA